MTDEIQAPETLDEPQIESLLPLENVFDQTPLLDGQRIHRVKMLRDLPTTLEETQAVAYLVILCLHQDPRLHPQIVDPRSIPRDYLWSTRRDRNSSILNERHSSVEERNHLVLILQDAPEMIQETGRHLGRNLLGDIFQIETF